MVEFEWDEDKRRSNIEKHELDFLVARRLFDGRPTVASTSQRNDESRNVTTGLLSKQYFTVVWFWREDKVRIISFRRANRAEEREHRAVYG